MREVWMPVNGYRDLYDASNTGKIRRNSSGLILTPSLTHGYLHVSLSNSGTVETVRVHVAVLTAFCGPAPFPEAHAAHNDGDKTNCALTNLRWATPIENQADVERHGRRCIGEAVFGAKLDAEKVGQIKALIAAGFRNRPIAHRFCVSISTIHLIRHNKIWRHLDG